MSLNSIILSTTFQTIKFDTINISQNEFITTDSQIFTCIQSGNYLVNSTFDVDTSEDTEIKYLDFQVLRKDKAVITRKTLNPSCINNVIVNTTTNPQADESVEFQVRLTSPSQSQIYLSNSSLSITKIG